MDAWKTYRITMHYALAICGSERALAVRLNVSLPAVRNFLQGISPIPDRIFLLAVDVIIAATKEDIARTREALRKNPYMLKSD